MKFWTENEVIIEIAEEIIRDSIWLKIPIENGRFRCYQTDAEIIELETIPEEVIPQKYKYVNSEFILNEKWIDPNKEELKIYTIGDKQYALIDNKLIEIV